MAQCFKEEDGLRAYMQTFVETDATDGSGADVQARQMKEEETVRQDRQLKLLT